MLVCRMPHRKWRETKQHPSRANLCQQLSCSLLCLHFLWGILRTSRVRFLILKCHFQINVNRRFWTNWMVTLYIPFHLTSVSKWESNLGKSYMHFIMLIFFVFLRSRLARVIYRDWLKSWYVVGWNLFMPLLSWQEQISPNHVPRL